MFVLRICLCGGFFVAVAFLSVIENEAKSNLWSLPHHLIWNVITLILLLLYQDGGSEANLSSFALNEIGLTD